jgi:hypothetical protein
MTNKNGSGKIQRRTRHAERRTFLARQFPPLVRDADASRKGAEQTSQDQAPDRTFDKRT